MAAVVPVTVCGRTFTMHVALESMNHGTSVWDGGVALAHFFDCNPKDFNSTVLRGKRVLELGSGCGLVSLVLASLGCHVVATDLPSVLPQLRLNVEANGFGGRHESGGSVTVEALDWAADEATHAVHRGVDIIVATDVVYHESVVPLLLECIRRIATPRTKVLTANEVRCALSSRLFLEGARALFHVKQVPRKKQHPEHCDDAMELLEMRAKRLECERDEDGALYSTG